jgi:hypothetical protein
MDTKTRKLEKAIDKELKEIYLLLYQSDGEIDVELCKALCRSAYGKGLVRGLTNPKEMKAWAKELGYNFS